MLMLLPESALAAWMQARNFYMQPHLKFLEEVSSLYDNIYKNVRCVPYFCKQILNNRYVGKNGVHYAAALGIAGRGKQQAWADNRYQGTTHNTCSRFLCSWPVVNGVTVMGHQSNVSPKVYNSNSHSTSQLHLFLQREGPQGATPVLDIQSTVHAIQLVKQVCGAWVLCGSSGPCGV